MSYQKTQITDRPGESVEGSVPSGSELGGPFWYHEYPCESIPGGKLYSRKLVGFPGRCFSIAEARAFALAILRACDECEAHEFTEEAKTDG